MVEEKNFYKVKAIPFSEAGELSCSPKMLYDDQYDGRYFDELPIVYHGPGNIRDSLYYIYDELTPEEQEAYKDKVVEIDVSSLDEAKKRGGR